MTHQAARPGIRVSGDFLVRSGRTLGPRTNDDYELLLFPQPSQTVFGIGPERYVLSEPSILLIPPFTPHHFVFRSDHPVRHLFIHFRREADSESDPIRSIPVRIPLGGNVIAEKMFAHILELANRQPHRWRSRADASLHLLLEELASQTQDTPVSANASYPPQIELAVEYIEARIDRAISIKTVADHVGWTHEYFTRTFTAALGMPPQQYILQIRIDRACDLLLSENWSVKEVAYSAGFQSEHYFCRVFHKLKGMTASQFREHNMEPATRHLSSAVPSSRRPTYRTNTYYFA